MNIVADLSEACTQLAARSSVAAIVQRWGQTDDPSGRLVLVAPRDTRYEEIQVLVGSAGSVTQIVFDLPRASPVEISELVNAYGEGNEELPYDGPPMVWFTPTDGGGCLISAALAYGASRAKTTTQISVVAPQSGG